MALPVDEQLRSVKLDAKGFVLSWWENDDGRTRTHPLTLDLTSGEIVDARGGPVPAEIQPFFDEPIPSWLLDDLYADWVASRPSSVRWEDEALRHWQPGDMLSAVLADPTLRPDTFVRGGRAYVVDLLFCAAPRCDCAETRLVALEHTTTPEGDEWCEIGSFELDADMTPRQFHGAEEHRATTIAVFLDWRARSVHPAARVAELRAHTRERGAVLHALYAERQKERPRLEHALEHAFSTLAAAGPTALRTPLSAEAKRGVGRNDPCPCGSGQKYKRCCARS